jgi:hypothetical protein
MICVLVQLNHAVRPVSSRISFIAIAQLNSPFAKRDGSLARIGLTVRLFGTPGSFKKRRRAGSVRIAEESGTGMCRHDTDYDVLMMMGFYRIHLQLSIGPVANRFMTGRLQSRPLDDRLFVDILAVGGSMMSVSITRYK